MVSLTKIFAMGLAKNYYEQAVADFSKKVEEIIVISIFKFSGGSSYTRSSGSVRMPCWE